MPAATEKPNHSLLTAPCEKVGRSTCEAVQAPSTLETKMWAAPRCCPTAESRYAPATAKSTAGPFEIATLRPK